MRQDVPREFGVFVGKKIKKIEVKENQVLIEFTNGALIAFESDEPDCCAHHYMSTDDIVDEHVDSKLIDAIIKPHKEVKDDGGDTHEMMFFEIVTTKGSIYCVSHNQHNGYYGGVGVNFKVLRSIQAQG